MINLNQCPQGDDFHSDVTGGSDEQKAATETTSTQEQPKKRRRRTRKEMEEARAAAEGKSDDDRPAPPVPGSGGGHIERVPAALNGEVLRAAGYRIRFEGVVYIEPLDHGTEG